MNHSSRADKGVRILVESAIMISLATVLSVFKLAELPYGGSITLASMLPIAILAYRHGALRGVAAGAVYGIIQQLLGLKNLSYFTTPISILAIILLDYLVAFAVIGLAGVFRRTVRRQSSAMLLGGILACLLRYFCHVISGATVWAGLSIPTEAALLYSLVYNATYMIPEAIVLLLATAYLSEVLDFTAEIPRRRRAESAAQAQIYYLFAALLGVAALIFGTVSIFSKLQNAETGEFLASGLAAVNWVVFAIVIGVLALLALLLLLLGVRAKKATEND